MHITYNAEPMARQRVSICIPTYNYAHYLGDAIRSACEQTYEELEIVVIDDASTDATVPLVEQLARSDGRIRLVRNQRNLGLQANYSRCIELADTDFVKILCADDWLAPDCVARMMAVLEARPEVALVACAREFVGSRLEHRRSVAYARRPIVEPGARTIRRCFFRGNLIGEPTAVLFRKSRARIGFDENYKQILDMELWFRILETGWFASLPEALCRFRQHEGRATFKQMDTGLIARDRIRLFHDFSDRPYMEAGLPEKLLWDARMAWVLAREPSTSGDPRSTGAFGAVYFPRLLGGLMAAARVAIRAGLVPRRS